MSDIDTSELERLRSVYRRYKKEYCSIKHKWDAKERELLAEMQTVLEDTFSVEIEYAKKALAVAEQELEKEQDRIRQQKLWLLCLILLVLNSTKL